MSGVSYTFGGLQLYKPVLDEVLNSPNGMVGKHLARRGRVIVAAAKRQVGVDTGALKKSIGMIHLRSSGGQYIRIGSDNKIALIHHNGSRPHLITPRGQHHLRFQAGGRVIYTRQVRHPGTRPNRYLTDNLRYVRA